MPQRTRALNGVRKKEETGFDRIRKEIWTLVAWQLGSEHKTLAGAGEVASGVL